MVAEMHRIGGWVVKGKLLVDGMDGYPLSPYLQVDI